MQVVFIHKLLPDAHHLIVQYPSSVHPAPTINAEQNVHHSVHFFIVLQQAINKILIIIYTKLDFLLFNVFPNTL